MTHTTHFIMVILTSNIVKKHIDWYMKPAATTVFNWQQGINRIIYTIAFGIPVVGHWLEWKNPMIGPPSVGRLFSDFGYTSILVVNDSVDI